MATRLVIEWTRSTLRLAVAETRGAQARLKTIQSQPIATSEEAAEVLRGLVRSMNVPSAEVIGVISREQVITRVVKFPAVDSTELSQMVEHYAKAQLPYPRDQTVMDFHVVSQHEGFSTVAIVACQREVVDRFLAILHEAGLSLNLLTVSSWGVLGWYRQLGRVEAAPEPSLIVNVDETRTDLVLIAQGHIVSSRSVSQGAQDWATPTDSAELLTQEVERSRAAIRKELPGAEVHSIVLTGLGALAPWSQHLSQRLGLPVGVVEASAPFQKIIHQVPAAISPVVVAGLAGSDLRGTLNLSPPELRAHLAHRQQVKELVTVGLLLVTALALGAGLLSLRVVRERRLALQLDHALAELAPNAKQIQEQTRSVQLVRSTLESRYQLALTLAGVFHRTPAEITLERLSFERARRELAVRGSASSTQAVLSYIKELERVDGVSGVELKFTTRRSTPTGERTDFELLLHQRSA